MTKAPMTKVPALNVSVQPEPFDAAAEAAALTKGKTNLGATVTFTGLVRADEGLIALTLEHYPAMTLSAMQAIAEEAAARWPEVTGTIIHRHGRLTPGEAIVLVTTASPHRGSAFESAQFLMDWLKTKAPFWKREEWADGTTKWVEAKTSDDTAVERWNTNDPPQKART